MHTQIMIGIPNVDVGILTERDVSFHFNGAYRCLETGRTHTGHQHATLQDGCIALDGHTFDTLHFEPTAPRTRSTCGASPLAYTSTGSAAKTNASAGR